MKPLHEAGLLLIFAVGVRALAAAAGSSAAWASDAAVTDPAPSATTLAASLAIAALHQQSGRPFAGAG